MHAHSVLFASLKAFGDFVIQLSVLKRASSDTLKLPCIAIGTHLLELRDALLPDVDFVEIAGSDALVPAAFDIKKQGYRAAARSLLRLRRQVGALPVAAGVPIAFDRLGWRESFIAGRRPALSLQSRAADNIYNAYEALLRSLGYAVCARPALPNAKAAAPIVGLFPGSRIAAKVWTTQAVSQMVDRCAAAGCEARVFLLEGERLDRSMAMVQTVPRRFACMVSAVRSVDRIVSADSLPAHLAEYLDQPVFVLSPVANPYWLPQSAWRADRWAVIDEPAAAMRIDAFLAGSTSGAGMTGR